MRILIVSPFFPPCNNIASLRPYSWAKWWSKAGHQITVVTSDIYQLPKTLQLDCSRFNVIQTPSNVPAFYQKLATMAKGKRSKEIERNTNLKSSGKKTILRRLLDWYEHTGVFGMLRYPDWYDWWVNKVKKLISPFDYDMVMTTSAPFGAHRVGYYIKKSNPLCEWVCDWRDLQSGNPDYKGIACFHGYEHHLERMFDNTADYVTTVSEDLATIIRKRTEKPVEVVYNGFDSEYIDSITVGGRLLPTIFSIAYVGTTYKGMRDPYPMLKAVSELHNEGKIKPRDIRLLFAGNCDCKEMVFQLGIADYYSYLGYLPYDEAIKLQYNSDALLFLEHGNGEYKGIMTAKIFEYIYTANEICSIGNDPENCTRKVIKECNAGVILGNDVQAIKQYLLTRIEQKKQGISYSAEKNMSEIMKYHRKAQAEKILSLVAK